MYKMITNAIIFSTLIVLTLGLTTPSYAEDTDSNDGWQQRFVIYGWLPSIDGTLNYDIGGGNTASVDPSDIVDALEGVLMGVYAIRKDKLSVTVDLIYLDLSNTENNAIDFPGPGGGQASARAKTDMTAWIVSSYGGYNTLQTEKVTMDLIAGIRYLNMDTSAKVEISGPLPPTLPSKKLSKSVDLWDGIIGVQGRYNLTDKWYVPYHLDVGTGDSDLTWQAQAAIAYSYKWGNILLAYRHLYYDQDDSSLIDDLEFSGPALGVNFNF